MLSYEDALARVQSEYADPETYEWVMVNLVPYETAQSKLCYTHPKNPRTVDEDGNVTKVPQKFACLNKLTDPLLVVGAIVTLHHGVVEGQSCVLWAYSEQPLV